jgi:flagellar biosynthesis protein FlhG
MMNPVPKKQSEIWAIGGGKGGTGKSFIISNMGHYLALKGKKVVLVDADLGGANLHTFLGTNKPKVSLTDFFDRGMSLCDLLVDTGVPNLSLLVGAIRSFSVDSIKHTQKLKFFRHIMHLDADYILIDLGAGTHFNTIDTYLIADKMIVVTMPEITAMENMYFFLRNVFFRKLMNALGGPGLKQLVRDTLKYSGDDGSMNMKQLVEYLKGLSNPIDGMIDQELSSFKIHVVINRIRSSEEVKIGHSVKSICRKYFGIDAQYAGYIEYDNFISRCINNRQPFMTAYPGSRCAKEIERLTENLVEDTYLGTKLPL